MKKTIVYIDGYNLYYGLLKGLPGSKWLDLRKLVASMFKKEHEICSIKFFSEHLKRAATYYAHIPRDLPAKCQLPEFIPVGTHGRTIHRPAAWA